jgi:sulfide:quinone oxidoreductase
MAHIVIVGAGIGGVPMAYEAKALGRPEDRVTVISDTKTFHFVPSNPWVAVNWRDREDIVVALEPAFKQKGIEFSDVGVGRVEPDQNRLHLRDGSTLTYDYLVIATGPELAFDEIAGLGPGQHTHSICHVDHAEVTGKAWEQFLADPGPIVVGAAQGASCFGPAYEYAMIMDSDLRRRRIRDRVPMTFVTPEPYIGHLGLGGVGDSKGLLEAALRKHDIKWICNAKVERVEAGRMQVLEHDDEGKEKRRHELPFRHAMILPAFRGSAAVRGIEGLVNPRGFVIVDKHQRNPKYPNIFAVGVCVAIAPVEVTPVPTGAPKTGYMIESMASAAAHNIRALIDGRAPEAVATLNAICLADFGDTGIAFAALPELPPRNVNWVSDEGRWVHLAKVAFERYFLRKVRRGITEPIYEKYILKALGIEKLKPTPSP